MTTAEPECFQWNAELAAGIEWRDSRLDFSGFASRAGASVRSAGGLREDVLAAELALIYANTVKTLILPAVLFQRPVGKDLIPFSPLSAQGALAYLQFTE